MDTTSARTAATVRVHFVYRDITASTLPTATLLAQQVALCRACINDGAPNTAYLAARRAAHLARLMETR